MDRRAFISMLSGSILAGPRVAETRPPNEVARIGRLIPGRQDTGRVDDPFVRALRDPHTRSSGSLWASAYSPTSRA